MPSNSSNIKSVSEKRKKNALLSAPQKELLLIIDARYAEYISISIYKAYFRKKIRLKLLMKNIITCLRV